MSHSRTLCPAHEKNAGDYEIGHESVRKIIYCKAKGHKINEASTDSL
jgi:hypothetical protein